MSKDRDPLMGSATSDSADFNERSHQSEQEDAHGEQYEAGGGKMSYHGVVYQLRLLMFFILRGLANNCSFSLATDMKVAEKFDDVVLRTKKGSSGGHLYRLLQAKHRAGENPGRITASALLSESSKADFSLRVYLKSYLKLRSKFTSNKDEIRDLVICTNVKFKENDSLGKGKLVDAFEEGEIVDEIFQVKLLRFKKEFQGKEILMDVLKKPLQGITHGEGDVESFLDNLSFAMDQYGNDDLEKQNNLLLQRQCGTSNTEIVFPLFEKKISDWMMSFRGSYFSEQAARKFIQSLKDKFGELSFEFQDPVWNFVGRERELEEMEMARKNGFKIVVISGLGGMGKSDLARKYIQKHSGVFKRIAWLTADSEGSLLNSFHCLATRLGIGVKEKKTKTVVEEVYAFFEDQDSVFVFDNVERLSVETEHNHYIKDFLPFKSKSPFVILTSRAQWNWEDAHNLSFSEITEDDAVDFIKSNLPAESHSSDESVKTLATQLQNFPLALQQAVAYIKRKFKESILFGETYCIDKYLETFNKEAGKILSCRILSSSRHQYERTTMSTWVMTFDAIKENEHGDTAVKILRLISHFAPDNIDIKNIFIYFDDTEGVKESLLLLKEVFVIVLNCNRIRIHRLVQKVTRLKLKETGEDEETLRWALKSARQVEVEHKISLWEKLDEYRKIQMEYSHLPGHIIESLKNSSRFEPAYVYGRKSVSLLKEICEPCNANLLTAMNSLAVVTLYHGHPKEALNMFEDILGRVKKEECDNESIRVRAPYNVVLNDALSEKVSEKFILYHERYKKEKNIQGEDIPDVLSSKFGMAACYTNIGNFTKALELYEEVNEKYEEILGEYHPNTLKSTHGVGLSCLMLGDFTKALTILEKNYENGKVIHGESNHILLNSKCGIASCYYNLDEYTEALKVFGEVYEKQNEILEENDIDTFNSSFGLAMCHSKLGDNNEALILFEEVNEKYKEILGENHPNTLNSRYSIANCHLYLGDYTKALILLEEVYEKQNEIHGENHYRTLHSKYAIAECHLHLGDCTKSLVLFEEIYEKQKAMFGEHDQLTLSSKCGIAKCYSKLGENTKA